MSAEALRILLRDPEAAVERCRDPRGIRQLAATALVCIIVGAGLFGGVMGSYRGGAQIVYSAAKLPLALLVALAVCAPAFHGLAAGFGRARPLSEIAALTLCGSARAALVLAACAPVLWWMLDRGATYHAGIMISSVMYITSGLAAATIVIRGLGGRFTAILAAMTCSFVFLSVLGQTAWMLRPFFGRPAQTDVPFLRAREGSFADAVHRSGYSALGIFSRRTGQYQSLVSDDADSSDYGDLRNSDYGYGAIDPIVEPAISEELSEQQLDDTGAAREVIAPPAAPDHTVPGATIPGATIPGATIPGAAVPGAVIAPRRSSRAVQEGE